MAAVGRTYGHDRARRTAEPQQADVGGLEPGDHDRSIPGDHRQPGLEREPASDPYRLVQRCPSVVRAGEPQIVGHVARSREVHVEHVQGAVGTERDVGGVRSVQPGGKRESRRLP